MVFIITTETFPIGLAATQRIKCYARSIAEFGYNTEVLCVNRCEDKNKPLGNEVSSGAIDGYSYRYLGGSTTKGKTKWKNLFYQMLDTLHLVILIAIRFTRDDKVVFYSYNKLLLKIVPFMCNLKRVQIFYELNEHPSIQIKGFLMVDYSEKDRKRLYNKLKRFDGFFCISSQLKDLLVKCGFEASSVNVVNMIVDAKRFDGIEKNTQEKYIAYCGAADNNKDGVDQLIKAFARISDKYPDVKLYIMGPKRPDCNNEELAKQLKVDDKVVFTGMVNPADMPQMLKNAAVLALDRPDSRQAKYGFPTKLGEYLLSGNPVAITGVGDIPSYLQDGKSAYIAEPDNIDSFASKLDEALSNPQKAELVGAAGKRVAEACFSDSAVRTQLKIAMNL